jgi:hypothetical protein
VRVLIQSCGIYQVESVARQRVVILREVRRQSQMVRQELMFVKHAISNVLPLAILYVLDMQGLRFCIARSFDSLDPALQSPHRLTVRSAKGMQN